MNPEYNMYYKQNGCKGISDIVLPEHRKKTDKDTAKYLIRVGLVERLTRQERSELLSKTAKRLLSDPDYKARRQVGINAFFRSAAGKEKMSLAQKSKWRNSAFRQRWAESVGISRASPVYRESLSNSFRRSRGSSGYRKFLFDKKSLWDNPALHFDSGIQEELKSIIREQGMIAATAWLFPTLSHTTVEKWLDGVGFDWRQESKFGGVRSVREKEVAKFLSDLGFRVEHSPPGKVFPFEIDVYLPDEKVGVEFNGFAFHNTFSVPYGSGAGKSREYHLMKSEEAHRKGVALYHFWEDTPIELVKSILLVKLGKARRVFARKCDLVQVSNAEASEFLERTHREGYTPAKTHFGLRFVGELISVLGVRSHKDGNEISRFATALGVVVVGGFSKLLSKVEEEFPGRIISYCDRDLTPDWRGSVYSRSGFILIRDAGPILKYWVSRTLGIKGTVFRRGVYSRHRFQKHLLREFPGYSSEKSEQEILAQNGIYPVYNSGNWRFEK